LQETNVTILPWTRSAPPRPRRRRRGAVAVPAAPDDWAYHDAIVCSGGGNLGAAQAGMLRALLEGGVVPDLFVGCSVGALNATFLAVDPTTARAAELEAIWRSLASADIFAGSRRTVATHLLRRDDHLYEADGLRALIARCVPVDDLSQTAVPLQVVTTDLEAGRTAWWTSGDPADVLAASACLPGLFPPVRLDGRLHVDGGVLCPVPLERAIALGAERVWVLDVSAERATSLPERPSALDVLLAAFAASRKALLADAATMARPGQRVVRITVDSPAGLDVRDFSRTAQLIDSGEVAARRALATIEAESVPDAADAAAG
jgi:NTE family protein